MLSLAWSIAFSWLLAAAPLPDTACLACHGVKGGETGRPGFVDRSKLQSSVHGGLGCADCHAGMSAFPHGKNPPKARCADCHEDAAKATGQSIHGGFGDDACTGCHGAAHQVAKPSDRGQPCATCHPDAVRENETSVHAFRSSKGDGANCQSCHGPAHGLLATKNAASPVAKKNLPDTCGACHANPEFLSRHDIRFARPVESYRSSVHGRAVERGDEKAAGCADCHGSHGIVPARNSRSRINHWAVSATCGKCHGSIQEAYAASVHGQASRQGIPDSPVCTDCHGEHVILAPKEPQSLVNPSRVSKVTCGRCHGDERLARRYGLPVDQVPAFEDSYHGLAIQAGSQSVANCASCHGAHNIFRSNDPRSLVHPANVASTCGHCHPRAGERFGIGPVHVRSATASEHAVVKWIRVTYLVLIPFTLGFMFLHNLVDFVAKVRRGGSRQDSGEQVERMNRHFRIAHAMTMISFPLLILTGFALKFPDAWWASPFVALEGHFAFRGLFHRLVAILLLISFSYHVVHLTASRRDRKILRHLLPRAKDLFDLLAALRYNLGFGGRRPTFGVFSYAEKAEYWAYMWGTAVMAISGFVLWFENLSLRNFPKWTVDAATAIHWYEAILASLSILIWHLYLVIFDPEVYPMERAWFTGKVSADHLRHTRPEYYASLVRTASTDDAVAEPTALSETAKPEDTKPGGTPKAS